MDGSDHLHHALVFIPCPLKQARMVAKFILINGTVSDKPRRLLRHEYAQAHNSTLYGRQHNFMYRLCSKQNCLLCA
jgi:hypothetical protein